ncbi:hypothetical protein JCM31447_25390 [Fluviispira sanaruensis]|uniref:Uncharacterized protein n=1 Tax=Fluviispira sanaruensis TaxID=2493639 RepID=A0A4P2VYK9_FLUSA|nr:hypothetical protein JCM31447_25390 [Fluviispira sanaruensis]
MFLKMPLKKYRYVINCNPKCQVYIEDNFLLYSERKTYDEIDPNINSLLNLFFKDYLRYFYPDLLPNQYNKFASDNRVNVACSSKEKFNHWENKYNEFQRYK